MRGLMLALLAPILATLCCQDAMCAKVVRFRLETTDLVGTPIEVIGVDQDFQLRGYAEDLRGTANSGVFAGYMDVTFDPGLASPNGGITYGPSYPNVPQGETTVPGLLDNIGAVARIDPITPLGPGEFLLYVVPFRAGQTGALEFTGEESNSSPNHDVLVYGEDGPVPLDEIDFGDTGSSFSQIAAASEVSELIDFANTTVQVVPEPSGWLLAVIGAMGLAAYLVRKRRR